MAATYHPRSRIMQRFLHRLLVAAAALAATAPAAAAQAPDASRHGTHAAHGAHGAHGATVAETTVVRPTSPGQDAFGAIAEVVRILERDPATDWSRVDLERLRQHLINMNELTLRSSVRRRAVPGGLEMTVTGTGRAERAIRAMTASHARQLGEHGLRAASTPVAGGARFTVTAADTTDAALVARVRGLGFIGIMALGDHHASHHLALARGATIAGHDDH
jgi:hypothetical protein